MNRRTFLTALGVGAAERLTARATRGLPTQGRSELGPFGIQLWSVRHDLQRNLSGTLTRLAAIGYSNVELVSWFGHFGRSAKGIRAALDNAGLRATSTHVSSSAVLVGWQRHLEEAHALGLEYVVCNSFSADEVSSLDDWREHADVFNAAGELARKADIWLAFHTEPEAFAIIDGQVPFDIFVDRTDPSKVRMQLDTGNVMYAGLDPLEYVRRNPDRYWSFHLKDQPRAGSSTGVAVGDGIGRFREFMSLIPDVAKRQFFVEFSVETDELRLATRSYRFLRALRW